MKFFSWDHWAIKLFLIIIIVGIGTTISLLIFNRRLKREILAHERTEKELKESEEKFRALFEQAGGYCMILDPNSSDGIPVIIDANEAACVMHGYTREEFIGRPVAVLDDEDGKRLVKKRTAEIMTGKKFYVENEHLRKDGTSFTVAVNAKRIDLEGKPSLILTTEYDISERKQIEEDIKKNQILLQQAEEISNQGAWEWNIVQDEWSFSENWLRIHGCRSSGITREELMTIAYPEDAPDVDKAFQDALKGGRPYDIEHRIVRQNDDEVRYVRAKGNFILNNSGQKVRMYGVAQDITDSKLAEEERLKLENRLLQSQKMESIGTLAGGVAHDFNNILAAILGYAAMAKDDSQPESTVAKDLEKVLEAGNRAKDLVQQILSFSRQDDTESIPLQPVSVVKEAIKILRPSLPTTIEINQHFASTTGLILADPTQIHQIMMNLCTNAFQAMEKTGGKLDISLKEVSLSTEDLVHEIDVQTGVFIQLSICDSGSGIRPDIKAKIFDPYFTTKETGKGTGMGLAIVHGIVKSYGGFISLYSELGEGTAFHVFLPVIGKEALPEVLPEIEVVTQIPVGRERILFVDDEEMLTQMGKTMLERLGYHVTARNSSIEALETFQNQPDQFDLIITDQTMPGMTGADIARRMIQIRPDIPIILCTGYSTIISEEKAKSMGIKEFALKPLSQKDIALLIRKVLDNSNMKHEI